MKKILIIMIFSVSLLFSQDSLLVSVLKNISIPDVNNAISKAKVLKEDINQKNFTKFMKSWKKVQALYFAGNINEDYIDTPRYIDVFHNLKEDLNKQMKRVVASKDEPRVALFKHSFKTINALEYVLFNDKVITKREKALAKVIVSTIISNLEDIKEVYSSYVKKPTKDEAWENAMILNTLIASTYGLKEWRIGDPGGNSAKYRNKPKNQRAEYYLSKNSFNAIRAILEAHDELIGDKSYKNFATMAKKAGAKQAIKEAQESLKKVLKELDKLPQNSDFTNTKDLFKASQKLHNAYYISLIEDLTIAAKILEADGD